MNSIFSRFRHPIVLCVLSAAGLTLAFPRFNIWIFSWVALVPMLLAIDGKTPGRAFGWSYLTGFLFFLATFYWFCHVTWIGMFLLCAYLALYFGVFGWIFAKVSRSQSLKVSYCKETSETVRLCNCETLRCFFLAAFWVVLEYVRGHLFSGFDWGSLSHSQSLNIWMIQIADITGVYGISFLIVMVNLAVYEYFRRGRAIRETYPLMAAVFGLCAAAAVYGFWRSSVFADRHGPDVRIGVIQANIRQDLKNESKQWPDNFDRHARLTFEAAEGRPDMIIWPETALPGYMWETDIFIRQLRKIASGLSMPLLIGAVTENDGEYFNSAMLLSDEGVELERYEKIHLVPFGEYIPLRTFLPGFIAGRIVGEDFSSGQEYTVFDWRRGEGILRWSALICFEDTLARLTRKFVLNGAEFLVNMTNDGWFKDSRAPFIHQQAAAFRSVENRRWLIRAANTGVSCAIDPAGRVRDVISDGGRTSQVSGFRIFSIHPHQDITFYTRFGDVFAGLCGLLVLLVVSWQYFWGKRS